MATEFKPRMLGIVCNWCCYGGADLAGVSRFQYHPYIRLIRVMCSGRVDMSFIFRALANGTDGMFIGGCHLGDCHYVTHGNHDAINMVELTKKILASIGVNPARLRLEWVSAGEGIRFASIMNEFAEQVMELGPLGKSEGMEVSELKLKLEAVTRLVPYFRVVQNERLHVRRDTEEEYKEYYAGEECDRLFRELIADKITLSEIMMLLREKSLSTGEMASIIGLTPSEISRHLISSASQGLIRYDADQKRFAIA